MTRVRALDGTHDWLFGKGQNDYLTANAAIAQNINTRLSSFLNDCFFDTGAGLDWFTFCGGDKNQLAVNLAISATILNTPNVTGIKQLSIALNDNTRVFTISYIAQTIFSQVANVYQFDVNGVG